jgi:serine/threonine protein kinase
MNNLLKMDPNERYTAIQALAHPYFDSVRDPEVEALIKSHFTKHIEGRVKTSIPRQERSKSRGRVLRK